MAFRYPIQPKDEDDFELFCLRLLRHACRRQHLQQNGKRGERQHGIDLIDLSADRPFRGVQCKHHEPIKTIPPSEIQEEVTKALGYEPRLEEFYILTTAKKTAQAQQTIIKLNRDHKTEGKFLVILMHWEEIEDLLDDLDEVSRDKVIHGGTGRSIANLQAVIPPLFQQALDVFGPGSESAIDMQLDAAKAAIDSHRHEVVLYKLDALETQHAARLSNRQRFRIMCMRANILIARGDLERAGDLLIRASELQPADERARTNEALGTELLGKTGQAHALAERLRQEFAQSGRIAAIWVRTAPPEVPFAEIDAQVGHLARTECDLALALADRALRAMAFTPAADYAALARDIDPQAPQSWFLLALTRHGEGRCSTGKSKRLALLRDADSFYTRGIELATAQGATELLAAARLNRGILRSLLEDPTAEADYLAAQELRPRDCGTRLRHAGYLLELGRFNDAIREAEGITAADYAPEAVFLAAMARFERNCGDDRNQAAIAALRVLDRLEATRRADAVQVILEVFIASARLPEAEAALTQACIDTAFPVLFLVLCARLSHARGDVEAAGKYAERARAAATDQTAGAELRLLAHLFVLLKRDEDALPLLERCACPGEFDVDTQRLLDCANRLERHDILLRVCRELREAGVSDRRLLDTEVNLQQLYDPPHAISLLQAYLHDHPDDAYARLRLTALALHSERPDLVSADPASLPLACEVDTKWGALAIHVLRETGQEQEAMRFAYELLRNNFEDHHAHGMYVTTVFLGERRLPFMRAPASIQPGTAVCFTEDGNERQDWIVIEENTPAKLADERAPDHPLVADLLGKRVADRFRLAPGTVQDRMGTVRGIANKYVYRLQKCMNEFQVRFQDASFFQMVRVVNERGEFDPTPILRTLDARRARIEALDRQYRENLMPVFLVGKAVGRDELQALDHLASARGGGIRCCLGTQEELQQATQALRGASAVVLDVTALYTLSRLEQLDVLRRWRRPFVVGQATYNLLRSLVREEEENPEERRGVMTTIEGGGYALVEMTPADRERQLASLRLLVSLIRECCEIRACPRVANLKPSQRDVATEVIGRHGLESTALAGENGHVLWTDDGVIALLGKAEFKTERVWTQLMLREAVQGGHLSPEQFDHASGRLLGARYQFTWCSASIIVASAELAHSRTDGWPLAAALDQLANAGVDNVTRLRIAAEAIHAVWGRSELSPFTRQGFLIALLQRIRSASMIRHLRWAVRSYFGLDVLAANDVDTDIQLWTHHFSSLLTP